MEEIKVRKMPRSTMIYISILVIAGIISFYIVMNGKETKVEKILTELGYPRVENLTVFGEHEFMNKDTHIKGKQYSIEFIDLSTGKMCRGFVFRDYKRNNMKDLECK